MRNPTWKEWRLCSNEDILLQVKNYCWREREREGGNWHLLSCHLKISYSVCVFLGSDSVAYSDHYGEAVKDRKQDGDLTGARLFSHCKSDFCFVHRIIARFSQAHYFFFNQRKAITSQQFFFFPLLSNPSSS